MSIKESEPRLYNYGSCLERISNLRERNNYYDARSAVLEARLALEAMAYDRLRASRSYISSNDLKKWKPKGIIDFLVTEVDARIMQSHTLSISPHPLNSDSVQTLEEYKKVDFQKVGTQSALDAQRLNKLWHKASSFLHLDLDKRTEFQLLESMSRFLDDFESFAKEVDSGNLLLVMPRGTVEFECRCGTKMKRSEDLLEDGMIVGCPNPECRESYICKKENDEYSLQDRGISFECPGCKNPFWVPGDYIGTLRGDQRLVWNCECGKSGYLKNDIKLFVQKSEGQ